MTTRNLTFSVEEYYHIYNRGTDKRDIFCDEDDKKRFIKLLYLANGTKPFVFRDLPIGVPYVNIDKGEPIVAIGAYVLMGNHFHLLIKELQEGGITKFISRVLTSYSSYFNKKYERTGGLFEGTFKATHADTDEYLKYLFAYIHLTPIKIIDPGWKENSVTDREEAKKYLAKYGFSSYLEYIGISRQEGKILDKSAFPGYFTEPKDFDGYINDWLFYKTT